MRTARTSEVTELAEGNLVEAEQIYRQGSSMMQRWHGPDHPDVATSTDLLARAMMANGKSKEAEPILARVLAIQERAYGPNHIYVAFTLDALGTVANIQNRLKLAKAYLSRALSIYHLRLLATPRPEKIIFFVTHLFRR